MTENFLNLMSYIKPKIQETQRTSSRKKYKTTPRHIQTSESQRKRKKNPKRCHMGGKTYKGANETIISDFYSEIMQVRRDWSKILKVLREEKQH